MDSAVNLAIDAWHDMNHTEGMDLSKTSVVNNSKEELGELLRMRCKTTVDGSTVDIVQSIHLGTANQLVRLRERDLVCLEPALGVGPSVPHLNNLEIGFFY